MDVVLLLRLIKKRRNSINSMDCLERNYAKIIAVNYDDFIDRLCSHKLQY